MQLEDHAGDVVRKARLMLNRSPEESARRVGLTLDEYLAFEDSGQARSALDFEELAPELGLDAAKLRRVYQGWLPQPLDVVGWRFLRRFTTTGRGMAVHCYLAWTAESKDAALFDTGFDAGEVLGLVETQGLRLAHIFLTHTHHDHVAGLEAVRARFPAAELHSDAVGSPLQCKNRTDDRIQIGSLEIGYRPTPGHAEDGATYVLRGFPGNPRPVAVVGDALFAGSIGGAKEQGAQAKRHVREQILALPSDTLICPGHGPLTTVGNELENNPFF